MILTLKMKKKGEIAMQSIYDEIRKLPLDLQSIVTALAQFAESKGSSRFQREGDWWIMRDNNWVGLQIRHKRAGTVAMSLWGQPNVLGSEARLPLGRSRASYSQCLINSPRDLKLAACYMDKAHQAYFRRYPKRAA